MREAQNVNAGVRTEIAPTRFRFGENWQSFLSTVDEASIAEAERGLIRLFSPEVFQGARFFDIGCGSGLVMLAAARLGARVSGVDLDPQSVAAASSLLSRHLPPGTWTVTTRSVFDLHPEKDGRFDIVHSWGVLHHTGDMWTALERATAMAAAGGRLAIALYRKTPFCGFWRMEKRVYAVSPPFAQAAMRATYKAAFLAGLLALRRNPGRWLRDYKSDRGMDWSHDVHDWLGGYPYESAAAKEVTDFLTRRGFVLERELTHSTPATGLFGTGCDEYVALAPKS